MNDTGGACSTREGRIDAYTVLMENLQKIDHWMKKA
jgi:hypothetical protein